MPLISIVLPTYNRPHLLPISVESILNQTFLDFELIVINNGSEAATAEVLASYDDPRLRVITLKENIGFAKASNLGFDAIEGEWFTLMSDDDNLLPEALERLISVPREIDPEINAVSCNCFSIETKEFTGKGLSKTGYVAGEDIIRNGKGEFWGITKTELLGDLRFNPNVSDDVNHLWYQIDIKANRYYLHEGLKNYDDGVGGRVSSPSKFRIPKSRGEHYKNLYHEKAYWRILGEYAPQKYKSRLIKACIVLDLLNEVEYLSKYKAMLAKENLNLQERFLLSALKSLPRKMAYSLYSVMPI